MILRELINSVEALNILTTTKLPARTSYKISMFLKDINEDVEMFNKTRNDKLVAFGDPIEGKDGQYSFSKENGEKFVEEIKEFEARLAILEADVEKAKQFDKRTTKQLDDRAVITKQRYSKLIRSL